MSAVARTALLAWFLAATLAGAASAQSYYNQTAADFLRGGPPSTGPAPQNVYNQTGADFLRGGPVASATRIMIQNKAPGMVQYAIRFGGGQWTLYNLGPGRQSVHTGRGRPSARFSNLSRTVTYDLRPLSVNAFVLSRPNKLDLLGDPNIKLR